MSQAARCRALSGKIFLKNLGIPSQPYLLIGNAQAELAITETEQTQPDYTNPAGGNACAFKEIDTVGLTLTVFDFKADNLSKAVFGNSTAGNATPIVNEAITIFTDGALVPTARVINSSVAVVVSIGATNYVQGTDYIVSAGGIVVIPGSALDVAVLAGVGTPKSVAGVVDYTPRASDIIQAITTSAGVYAVKLEGYNKADNNKEELWTIHRMLLGPTGSFSLISREFGSFVLNASITADSTRPPGESQYFNIEVVG